MRAKTGRFAKKAVEHKRIARERIDKLFTLAKEADSFQLADRYISLARKLSMKYKVRIPRKDKRSFCKHCFAYLMPGKNVTVRTHNGKVVYTCHRCKGIMRYPYIREQKAKRVARRSK